MSSSAGVGVMVGLVLVVLVLHLVVLVLVDRDRDRDDRCLRCVLDDLWRLLPLFLVLLGVHISGSSTSGTAGRGGERGEEGGRCGCQSQGDIKEVYTFVLYFASVSVCVCVCEWWRDSLLHVTPSPTKSGRHSHLKPSLVLIHVALDEQLSNPNSHSSISAAEREGGGGREEGGRREREGGGGGGERVIGCM